jgi:hypothetical protein
MVKEIVLNKKIFYHCVDPKNLKDIYVAKKDLYNMIINENIAIVIKKAIPENNEQNFKPRPEVLGKIEKNKNGFILKFAIGKEFKTIEGPDDIAETFEIPFEDYEIYKNFIKVDFEKYEDYENIKKQLKLKNTNKIKNINF